MCNAHLNAEDLGDEEQLDDEVIDLRLYFQSIFLGLATS